MASVGGGKRKRGDRNYSYDSNDGTRPSPHRPGNLNLAYHNQNSQNAQNAQNGPRDQQGQRGRGGRRSSGRGHHGPQSPSETQATPQARSFAPPSGSQSATPKAVSPSPQTSKLSDAVQPTEAAPLNSSETSVHASSATPRPLLYHYEYLGNETVKNWEVSGLHQLVHTALQLYQEEKFVELAAVFYELVRSALDARLKPEEAGMVVKELIAVAASDSVSSSRNTLDLASLFLDCLSLLSENDTKNRLLPRLVFSTEISASRMRVELEHEMLEQLGLVRSTFARMGIRNITNQLYRQSNYNLLREETEGYSKLVTELFTTSSNELPSASVAEETFEKVKAMIGTFDLDVGRVLDITLDVFAAVLVKQYRFFVKYLRDSSWWPQSLKPSSPNALFSGLPKWALPESSGLEGLNEVERSTLQQARLERDIKFWNRVRDIGVAAFFELGDRCASSEQICEVSRDKSTGDEDSLAKNAKWVEVTGTLPPPGNKVAAQILGFKLQFYSSVAHEANDILPVNLIYLAALLIKIGFISLRDLYPHLWPLDAGMGDVREQKAKEKADRDKLARPGGGTLNALMTAGALVDDTLPSSGRPQEPKPIKEGLLKTSVSVDRASTPAPGEAKPELPPPSDQKVQLLRSLLCIGAIPEALYMLGRFPWLIDAFPDLPEHLHRILHQSLSKVYEPLQPLQNRPDVHALSKILDPDQTGVPKGQIKQVEQPARRTLRWAQLDKVDTTDGTDYRFYWDDWADNVPVCQTVDDVFSLSSTLLNYSGVKIGQDPSLLTKLARIGQHSLATDLSISNNSRWVDLSKRLLVPALSLTKNNPAVVNEVWELVRRFPTATRYNLYAEWYHGQISRLPDMLTAFDLTKAETKDVLKRISKTNLRPMARALAKVATASPGIVFQVAISQIESYDNLVEVVVECARYFTELGYDVLTWALMSSLGARGRNRVQADGMLTSKWLSALSLFAGKAFKRYAVMSPTPVLQYVNEQLRLGNSTDLIVLEEITSSMAGIVTDTNFNEAQVLAFASGPLLQARTMLQLLDRRHESETTAERLMESLVKPKLAGPLLVSIAQERQTCVYKLPDNDSHLKLLGNLFDEIHRVFTQYLDLLRSNLSVEEFDGLVPSVSSLMIDFGIEPSVAFWICRPSIAAAMSKYDKDHQTHGEAKDSSPDQKAIEGPESRDPEASNGSVAVNDLPLVPNDIESITLPTEDVVMAEDLPPEDLPPEQISTASARPSDEGQWHPILQELMTSVRPTLPEQVCSLISEGFFLSFWQLSLSDILVSLVSYEDEVNRLKKRIQTIASDRTDISVTGTQKKDREKRALNELQDRLRAEMREQVLSYQHTRARLQREKCHWFTNCWGRWDALNIALIEQCFFPRIRIAPVDAIYTFKLIKMLHCIGTKNFRTMGLYDQIFNSQRLSSMIFLCTAKEVENLGRFLNEILKDLAHWHAEKANYEKEAYGPKRDLPGFCMKMGKENQAPASVLEYEDFRKLLLKWHMNLHGALKACLSGGEYMHIRNAIIVLRTIYLDFPVVNWMGQNLVTTLTGLSKNESRDDLKLAAASLLGNLRRREKEWVLPQSFSLGKAQAAATSSPVKPGNQIPEPEPSKLNAKAPDFNPTASTTPGGKRTVTVAGSTVDEEDDGEINDVTNTKTDALPLKDVPRPASDTKTTTQLNGTVKIDPAAEAEHNRTLPESAKLSLDGSGDMTLLDTSPKPTSGQAKLPPIPPKNFRSDSGRHSADSNQNHLLPTRPESLPARSGPPRAVDRPREPGRDSRELAHSDQGRDGHELRDGRDGRGGRHAELRDRPSNPHGSSSANHDRPMDRPSDRQDRVLLDRSRAEASWNGEKAPSNRNDSRYLDPRDFRTPTRDDRPDRQPRDRVPDLMNNVRSTEAQGRSSRDSSMVPPRAAPQHSDRSAGHSSQEERNHHTYSDRRVESHSNPVNGSRAPSPSREDRHTRNTGSSRDERLSTDAHRNDSGASHLHRDDQRMIPASRTDKSIESSHSPNERFKESTRGSSFPGPPNGSNHGRLNPEPNSRQKEPQFGRLNPDSIAPKGPGPQGAVVRGNARSNSATYQERPASGQALPSPGEKQAPTGPSGNRGVTRNPVAINRPLPPSGPNSPVTEGPPTPGIHPDRLRALQQERPFSAPPSKEGSSLNASSMPHGPRADSQLPSPLVNHQHSQLPSPKVPNSSSSHPPSMPANDRSRNDYRGPDKRFASIQNVLQQANNPHPMDRSTSSGSIRGRSGRQGPSSNGMPPPMPPGPSQSQPQSQAQLQPLRPELLPRRDVPPYHRNDNFSNRNPRTAIPPSHATANTTDDHSSRTSDRSRDSDHRSDRHREAPNHQRRDDHSTAAIPHNDRGPLPQGGSSSSARIDDNRNARDNGHGQRHGGSGGGGGGEDASRDHRDRNGAGGETGNRDERRSREDGKERGRRDGEDRERERERREGGGRDESGSARKRRGDEVYAGDGKRIRREG